MASRRITQETFDAVVQENISEFEMDPEEALKDAVKQFKSQGVDLSSIVQSLPSAVCDDHTHSVIKALQSLPDSDREHMLSGLSEFAEQCKLGFAQRHLAAQKDAYPTILGCCRRAGDDGAALLAALSALAALCDGQPDLLDAEGRGFLLGVLERYRERAELTCVALRVLRFCCLKHEQNRQDLVKGGALGWITQALTHHRANAELVKESAAAMRVMTFDDDVRVPFGQAHEHAKMIVLEHGGLKAVVDGAKAHPQNTGVLRELCSTLARLAVRNEFCQDIVDLGGLDLMLTLLADNLDQQDLVKQLFGVLRAVAGNDDVKDAIVSGGGTQLMVMAMNRHMTNAQVCEQGCAALCALALRKPKNCKAIMESGGALVTLHAMRNHPGECGVQKQACLLLRVLVSRTQDLCQPILDMGAESLVTQALETHRECEDAARAALRDLGCQVQLRELWTGKKGGLSN